jgi:hypothetical protein
MASRLDLHRAAENQAVGPRKINVLKNAARLRCRRRHSENDVMPSGPTITSSPGLHVALVDGAEQIEGARLRGENDGVLFLALRARDASHGERAESPRIAGGEDTVAAQHDQRKGAFHPAQRVGDCIRQSLLARERNQMHNHFGIAVGLEDRSLALQLRPESASR